MCIHIRTVFRCNHEVWGRRVKACRVAQDFKRGKVSQGCRNRKPHGLLSRRLQGKCEKCRDLDYTLDKIKVGIAECKAALREKRWVDEGEEEEAEVEEDEEMEFIEPKK
ncbi:hypothetical protein B0T10DRAFT_543761 [Thelonectria olida]|uniref:Uncharacterized protein n=1 Tax=Thelonectria olida TaxID=1576542 RepID=A0A9P8WHC2_9HYPO|nr:hypothetical protein B0T10DRAFT_543761 [Thelonectria olida]